MSDAPTRIAFCITELDPGGAEQALVQIVSGLERDAWDPIVYCLAERGPLADELESARVPVVCLNARSARQWGVILRLRRELRKFRPTILQTFLFHANLAGRLAAWMARVPIVVSGIRVVEPDAQWRHRLDRWTNRFVTHNVCVSRGVADICERYGIPPEKTTVIPNGVDAERIANALPVDLSQFGVPHSSRTIVSVGRLHPQKGFPLLLAAVEPLLAEWPKLHLLIVGEGPQRDELASWISSRGLSDRIHLAGRQADVPGILRASDVFVLASRWEGMPNALLEAMAAGLPVVATRVEGCREVVSDGQTGLLVEPASSTTLTRALRRILEGADLAAAMGCLAQVNVREKFTWHAVVRNYAELYAHLISRRPR